MKILLQRLLMLPVVLILLLGLSGGGAESAAATIHRDAKFVDLLKALLIAAEKLIGQGKLSPSAIPIVTNAFNEVGILLPVHA